MADTINSTDLAAMLGVSTRSIRDFKKRGIIIAAGRDFALAESVRSYCGHLRKLADGRGGEPAIANATAERGRLAAAHADNVELKNQRIRGELVPAADVEAEWAGVLRTVRAGMLAVPSRVQQRLPHLTAHDVSELDREIRDVLSEVGGGDGANN